LETGSALVYAETSYGTVPLATLQAPRLFGEIGVLANIPRTASVRVVERALVHAVSKAVLIEFAANAPAFLLAVIEQLGRQLDGVNKAISLYANALNALERREFDSRILDDLKNPTPQLREFEAAFRRFAGQILDKRRVHDEMASAALIQQAMLPHSSAIEATRGTLDLHAEMRPALQVGGDLYDFFMLNQDRLAFTIGDVCGKGIPASLFMAMVVTVLRIAAKEVQDVGSIMRRANAILCCENASSMFATLFFGILDLRTGLLEYCNCGHIPPVVLSHDTDLRRLPGSGLPIGLFPDQTQQVHAVALVPEDRLFLFTDGITEAMSVSGVEFGEDRLEASITALRALPASELVLGVISAVKEFTHGAEQSDDITCLAIRWDGP
jgi:serine phosphatase RsbU (regulator of sigma subunit)